MPFTIIEFTYYFKKENNFQNYIFVQLYKGSHFMPIRGWKIACPPMKMVFHTYSCMLLHKLQDQFKNETIHCIKKLETKDCMRYI